MSDDAIRTLLADIKAVAARYYAATGRPLGVTCEIGEYEAATQLGLTLAPVRTPAYDALRPGDGGEERVQIKARNERGSMGISQFKSIATRVWPNV